MEELKIDWPAWAAVVRQMMAEGTAGPGYIAPGIRLIRKIENSYGDEVGLAIRLEEPDGRSYRMASREWALSELKSGFDRPVEWWVEELQRLFADALSAHRTLLPDPGRELRCIIRRRVELRSLDGDGKGYKSVEDVTSFVPDDRYSRAYLASLGQTGDYRDRT